MNVVITGASSGLGFAIANTLEAYNHNVMRFDYNASPKNASLWVDVSREADEIADQFDEFMLPEWPVDLLVNCAGINSNNWFEQVTRDEFDRVMHTNAWSFVSVTQALLERLKLSSVRTVINIVSNAAHIPMTSSLAYNASKAAGLMITKQMAHELAPKYGLNIFSISPNKLAGTGMSKQIEDAVCKTRGWTPEFAAEYQKKALMHGRETEPQAIADYIRHVMDSGAYRFLSGTDQPFGK